MKRDARLRGLSSEHHQALVLARTTAADQDPWTEARGAALLRRFASELEPHFRVEEELLLPALRLAGERALADRTAEEHARLRALAAAAGAGEPAAARAFGELLQAHVRFEERDVFPACEARLPDDVLDAVARSATR